ncbi:MAG: class II aldolase/adducin family protein [Bdellovibrionales bacterium]|nr:class II aldolase/adducin family protein [Bdellovibrionales bacterium]
MDITEIKKELIQFCKRLHSLGFLAAGDGNLSFRLDDENILITPKGVPKAFIDEKDLAILTLSGEVKSGSPSSERLMHLEVYRNCPKAKAVFHAHPPLSVAWSIAFPEQTEVPNYYLSELILAVGAIPIAPYARPGTQQMGDHIKSLLPDHRVMILSQHGALTWGESLLEAYMGMERLEHTVKILKMAKDLNPNLGAGLPESEIQYLKEIREQLGEKTL